MKNEVAAVVTTARALLGEFLVRWVSVATPLRVATDTWADEIAAGTHRRLLSHAVLVGIAAERVKPVPRLGMSPLGQNEPT